MELGIGKLRRHVSVAGRFERRGRQPWNIPRAHEDEARETSALDLNSIPLHWSEVALKTTPDTPPLAAAMLRSSCCERCSMRRSA